MDTKIKRFDAQIIETKAATVDGKPQGIIKTLWSAYDVIDFDGDVTRKGSFDTLIAAVKAGARLPYVFAHGSWEIANYLGIITDIEETDAGPVATAELFLDDPPSAKAFKLLEAKAVRQHSYAYRVKASHQETVDGITVNVLDDVEVFEIGPCLRGANDQTDVIDAKGMKAGRVLSAANESALRGAIETMQTVLDQVAAPEPKSDSSQGETKSAEDPPAGNADVKTGHAEDPSSGNADPVKAITAEDLQLITETLRLRAETI